MPSAPHAKRAHKALPRVVAALGIYHFVLGAVMVVVPRTFFDEIAAFGTYNAHFIRDLATFYVALGAVMLIAARRQSWRRPVLTFAVLQYTFHVVNHTFDVNESEPGWIGPLTLIALAAVGALLWALVQIDRADLGPEEA